VKIQLKEKNRGFTLAEMAVVVVIASILLVAGVKVLTAQMDSASYSATRTKQEAIKQALITYLGNNKRLPCPDSRNGAGPGALNFTVALPPDGIENRQTAGNPATNCAASFGVLPYATLRLARDVAMDGWGNLLSYQLSTAPDNWALTASFSDTNTGGLTVNDSAGAALTTSAVVNIISHGKNGSGAYTIKGTRAVLPVVGTNPDESENADEDTTYVKNEYTDAFDDLLLFIMADDLIAPLRREGTIKNMQATVAQQLDDISRAMVGTMMGAGCNTPANIAGLGLSSIDPWDTAIAYATDYAIPPLGNTLTASDVNLVPAGTAASTAYTLTSNGPDRAVGGGDDVALSMTVGQLRGLLGTAYATRCP